MKSRSYMCLGCRKGVKLTSSLIRHVNTYKISITLPSRQPSNLASILEYNTTNHLNLPSDNNEENISLETSNNGKKRIRLTDIDNDEKDIRPADIDK